MRYWLTLFVLSTVLGFFLAEPIPGNLLNELEVIEPVEGFAAKTAPSEIVKRETNNRESAGCSKGGRGGKKGKKGRK